MKHALWILLAVLLVPSFAVANVRAPINEDGDVVIATLAREASENITLKHQKLVITMPRLVEKEFPDLRAQIKATYTFNNSSTDTVTVPAIFLATDIRDAVVTVNGKKAGSADADMNDAQWRELEKAVGEYSQRVGAEGKSPVDGKTATFEMRLAPGENTVVFAYAQLTSFAEGGTRYGGPKHDRSGMGLTYLLYPCKEWNLADDFSFDVNVRMPDYVKKGWFWDTRWAPNITTNLSLTPTYDKKARLTTLSGTFQSYPHDVLSVSVRRGEKR